MSYFLAFNEPGLSKTFLSKREDDGEDVLSKKFLDARFYSADVLCDDLFSESSRRMLQVL